MPFYIVYFYATIVDEEFQSRFNDFSDIFNKQVAYILLLLLLFFFLNGFSPFRRDWFI